MDTCFYAILAIGITQASKLTKRVVEKKYNDRIKIINNRGQKENLMIMDMLEKAQTYLIDPEIRKKYNADGPFLCEEHNCNNFRMLSQWLDNKNNSELPQFELPPAAEEEEDDQYILDYPSLQDYTPTRDEDREFEENYDAILEREPGNNVTEDIEPQVISEDQQPTQQPPQDPLQPPPKRKTPKKRAPTPRKSVLPGETISAILKHVNRKEAEGIRFLAKLANIDIECWVDDARIALEPAVVKAYAQKLMDSKK